MTTDTITAAHRVITAVSRISTTSPTQGTRSTTCHGTQWPCPGPSEKTAATTPDPAEQEEPPVVTPDQEAANRHHHHAHPQVAEAGEQRALVPAEAQRLAPDLLEPPVVTKLVTVFP